MNNSLRILLKAMTYEERLRWWAAARYITLGEISVVADHGIIRNYVAKIHGVIVASEDGKFMFPSAREARDYGNSVLKRWKAEAAALPKEPE